MRVVTPEENARRMYAYTAAANDHEAATMLEIREDTFRRWRAVHGLAPKSGKKPKGKERPQQLTAARTPDLEAIRALLPR